MDNMTFIFPVEEAVLREAWVERGVFVEPRVTLVVPMADVPKVIRRRWSVAEVNLTDGCKKDGDLIVSFPRRLGRGVSAPTVAVTGGEGCEPNGYVLLSQLADAIEEADRLHVFEVEKRITKWLQTEPPESMIKYEGRSYWIEIPADYRESARVEEVELEALRRREAYQEWQAKKQEEARERARVADRQQAKDEALRADSLAAWLTWAAACGSEDLREAVEGNYPVGDRIEREVADLLPTELAGCEVLDSGYEIAGDRPVPNATARHVRAKLVALVDDVKNSFPPSHTEVSRIKRVLVRVPCPECGNEYDCGQCPPDEKRTGVAVTIRALHLDQPIVRVYVVEEQRGDTAA